MSGAPFRDAAPPSPPEASTPSKFRRIDWRSVFGWIQYGILAAGFVVATVHCFHGRWLPALVVSLVWVGVPLAAGLTYPALQLRIEKWQAKRTAREVARLMARD